MGKTIEIIALITLHKRLKQVGAVFDPYTGESVRPTNATLIITPPSILRESPNCLICVMSAYDLAQWISEIRDHAPGLRYVIRGVSTYYSDHDKVNLHKVLQILYSFLSSFSSSFLSCTLRD